jgi:hypothetical protein
MLDLRDHLDVHWLISPKNSASGRREKERERREKTKRKKKRGESLWWTMEKATTNDLLGARTK